MLSHKLLNTQQSTITIPIYTHRLGPSAQPAAGQRDGMPPRKRAHAPQTAPAPEFSISFTSFHPSIPHSSQKTTFTPLLPPHSPTTTTPPSLSLLPLTPPAGIDLSSKSDREKNLRPTAFLALLRETPPLASLRRRAIEFRDKVDSARSV